MRNQFTTLFDQILRNQLILKGIIKEEDWQKFRPEINWEWSEDSYYREIKNSEMIQARLNLMRDVTSYAGRYFSMDWIKKNILQFSDEDIRNIQKEIDAEVNDGSVAKDATIEWGDTTMQQQEPEPPEEAPEAESFNQLIDSLNGNGTDAPTPELIHINNLEDILLEAEDD